VLHRRHSIAAGIRRLASGLMPDELLAGDGIPLNQAARQARYWHAEEKLQSR
jgi:hypothetical protein